MNLRISTQSTNIPKVSFKGAENRHSTNPPAFRKMPEKDTFEMSIGYVNDLHGQSNNMMRVLSGIKGDLKLSAGDNDIGDEKNEGIHKVVAKFLNIAEIKASALGNHEIDQSQKDFVKFLDSYDGDVLSINFEQTPLEEQSRNDILKLGRADMKKALKKSKIVEVKGEKIGLIGTSPMDMLERLTHPNYYNDCYVDKFDDTIQLVQEEIDKLKEKNVNKIILLSHLGYKRDKILAKQVDGLDVILSGHTHELIKDIKEGENLFYSKSGEPIILTEAGRDGHYFGRLNLTFDKDGVITKAQNNIGEARIFHKNMINQYLFDYILGAPEQVGYVKQAPPPPASLIEENPHANFVCDAMRAQTNSDIALWHNCGVRNFFHEGVLDTRDVKDMAPFLDYVVTAKVSEKRLVETFKKAIEDSYESPNHKPGLIGVSGLNYTVNEDDGELVEMNYIDKLGIEHKIDIENPRENKIYKVVADEFLMSAGADYKVLAEEENYIKVYPYDKDVVACQYIKELNKPLIINQTGRIRFVKDKD